MSRDNFAPQGVYETPRPLLMQEVRGERALLESVRSFEEPVGMTREGLPCTRDHVEQAGQEKASRSFQDSREFLSKS